MGQNSRQPLRVAARIGDAPERGAVTAGKWKRGPEVLFGDLTSKAVEGGGAVPMRLISGRIPKKILGPLLHLDSRPACGDATV